MNIPKRFIRIWLGKKEIPEQFEAWWYEFRILHPFWDFVTVTDKTDLGLPSNLQKIYNDVSSYASRADVLRIYFLYTLGGIYIDTDMLPLKSFEELTELDGPFAGQRSSKSFETAVLGSPKYHPATARLIELFPEWYWSHREKSASVCTGPAFISSVWFGRSDVKHLPIKTFYPYNGFGAPKRAEKEIIFNDRNNFPPEMLAAHFSNHIWGGKPK